MSEEYFWGLTLKGGDEKTSVSQWDPDGDVEEATKPGFRSNQSLIVKQAVLGAEAKEGEINVVQVEALGCRQSIKVPVCVLKAGSIQQVLLDLTFPDAPVTFSLVQGNGPVHLIGNHAIGGPVDEEIDDEMDEEELGEEEEGEDGETAVEPRKRKLTPNQNKVNNKKAKLDEEPEEMYDEEDET